MPRSSTEREVPKGHGRGAGVRNPLPVASELGAAGEATWPDPRRVAEGSGQTRTGTRSKQWQSRRHFGTPRGSPCRHADGSLVVFDASRQPEAGSWCTGRTQTSAGCRRYLRRRDHHGCRGGRSQRRSFKVLPASGQVSLAWRWTSSRCGTLGSIGALGCSIINAEEP